MYVYRKTRFKQVDIYVSNYVLMGSHSSYHKQQDHNKIKVVDIVCYTMDNCRGKRNVAAYHIVLCDGSG